MTIKNFLAPTLFLLLSAILMGQGAGVAPADLLKPLKDSWPTYNGDYTGRRFSGLAEINRSNAARLRAAWVFHPGNTQRLEATPVVIRGVMYVTSANDVFALDARTGRSVWHYSRPVSSGLLDDAAAHGADHGATCSASGARQRWQHASASASAASAGFGTSRRFSKRSA